MGKSQTSLYNDLVYATVMAKIIQWLTTGQDKQFKMLLAHNTKLVKQLMKVINNAPTTTMITTNGAKKVIVIINASIVISTNTWVLTRSDRNWRTMPPIILPIWFPTRQSKPPDAAWDQYQWRRSGSQVSCF